MTRFDPSSATMFGALLWLAACGGTTRDSAADAQSDLPDGAPYLNCTGKYESLPVKTPVAQLPALFEAELCNFRDSRVYAIEAIAARPVTITLENPASIDSFRLGVYRTDVNDYQRLPVSAGATEASLGLTAQRTISFTPQQSGAIALYAAGGMSRGEAFRLRAQQE